MWQVGSRQTIGTAKAIDRDPFFNQVVKFV